MNNPKFPIFVQWETTYACQSKCIFCYNSIRESKLTPKSVAFKVARALVRERIPHVQLTGGEATLLPYLIELVQLLSKQSAVSVVTNGIQRIDLPTYSLMSLFVSFHGSADYIHEALTQTPGTYARISRNIEHYATSGMYVCADVLLTSVNFDDIESIIFKAYDLGVKAVFINRFQCGGIGSLAPHLMPSLEQFKEALTQIIRARRKVPIPVEFGTAIPFCADPRLIEENLHFNCGAGTWFAAIDPAGNVRICNQAPYSIGNILNSSLGEIWSDSNPILKDYRSISWMKEPCSTCPLSESCWGGCRVDSTCNPKRTAKCDYYIKNGILNPKLEDLLVIRKMLRFRKKQISKSMKGLGLDLRELRVSRFVKVVHRKSEAFLVTPRAIMKIKQNLVSVIDLLSSRLTSVSDLPRSLSYILFNLGVLENDKCIT